MRILVVSSYLPYPLFDGGSVRLYNLLKQLSTRHKITLICEIRSMQNEENVKQVEKLCEEVIVIPHRKPWTFKNIVKTGFSTHPLLLTMHTFPEMKEKIVEELNKKRFDVIHVETFYVAQNVPKTYLPVVLAEHNIEYHVYERYASTVPMYLRPLLYADILKLKREETYFWKKVDRLIAVSEEEKSQMNRNDVIVVPNGVDLELFSYISNTNYEKKKEKRVLFMGSFKWIQNVKAVEWILTEIWPNVIASFEYNNTAKKEKKEKPPVLWIVGKQIPDSLKAYESDTVIFDEHAPDQTWRIYHMSDVLLAPLKVGGGSSYKIIEAMASGIPVVTTELGVKGLLAKPGTHLLQGETSEELANHTIKLLQTKTLSERIRINARKLIEEEYDWKKIAKTLEGVYNDVAREDI